MDLDRNQALKRIREEYIEIESNPSDNLKCLKLDWNPYEWQFAVRGASGTEFEGGIYHGRVLFPTEYPCKPPSIIALTENGRFKTHTEISLRRLDKWQPSYRVRDVLVDFIHLMPTYPDGELYSLEYNKEERRDLAIKSRAAAPKYGTSERQKVIDEIHEYMLSKAPPEAKRKHGRGGTDRGIFNFGNSFHNFARGIFHSLNEAPKLLFTTPFQEEVVVDQVGSTQMEWDRSVIAEDNYNIKNSGEKRILEEYNEIETNPSFDFKCLKLDRDPYEWQFAIRGPSGTEFEDGIYHGKIQFPKEYPSKPPSITLMTKNGRFKIQTDISSRLLSNWQSPRSVQNALLALIEEMPTYPDGDEELDSVKCIQEVRRALAIESRTAAPIYGRSECQEVIDKIHQYMLRPVPQRQLSSPSQASKEHEHEHYQNDGAENVGISDLGHYQNDGANIGFFNFGNTKGEKVNFSNFSNFGNTNSEKVNFPNTNSVKVNFSNFGNTKGEKVNFSNFSNFGNTKSEKVNFSNFGNTNSEKVNFSNLRNTNSERVGIVNFDNKGVGTSHSTNEVPKS